MEYVKVSDGNISIEIETEKDGSLLMDNIKSAFQSATGLYYIINRQNEEIHRLCVF